MKDSEQRVDILLVDDSDSTCESVRTLLEDAGYRVQTLNGPFGFIKAVREHVPKLVLIDVGLGTMNGTKLVPLGRQHAPRHTKILLFSGRDTEELMHDVRVSGADGFVSKNESPEQLAIEVGRWMNRAR